MTIKSFFADTVAEAIRAARKELGEEAMLLKSRRSPEEARHLGAYEVVLGITETASLPAALPGAATASSTVSESIWDVPSETPRGLAPAAAEPGPADMSALYSRLIELEFDKRIAAQFSERVQARLLAEGIAGEDAASRPAGCPHESVGRAINLEAERLLPRGASLDGAEGGLAALMGPPGGGKTSTVVRLAVAYGLARGRRVVLLAANDYRVAASAKLRQYACLLGVDFHEAAGVEDLWNWVQGRNQADLMLIDTPGYGPRDMESTRALADFLAGHQEIEKHLVLPATLKGEDIQAPVERFEAFGTDYLLFTKLDEAVRCGSLFSQASAIGKPISFFTTGQQVPGDLVAARQFDLSALLQTRNAAMASAA